MASEPGSKKHSWELLNLARGGLPEGEVARFAWFGVTGPHPDAFLALGASFVFLFFFLAFGTPLSIWWAAILGLVAGLIAIRFLRRHLEELFKIVRVVCVMAESKRVFAIEIPLHEDRPALELGELEDVAGAISDARSRYSADTVLGRKVWFDRSQAKEIESATRYFFDS